MSLWPDRRSAGLSSSSAQDCVRDFRFNRRVSAQACAGAAASQPHGRRPQTITVRRAMGPEFQVPAHLPIQKIERTEAAPAPIVVDFFRPLGRWRFDGVPQILPPPTSENRRPGSLPAPAHCFARVGQSRGWRAFTMTPSTPALPTSGPRRPQPGFPNSLKAVRDFKDRRESLKTEEEESVGGRARSNRSCFIKHQRVGGVHPKERIRRVGEGLAESNNELKRSRPFPALSMRMAIPQPLESRSSASWQPLPYPKISIRHGPSIKFDEIRNPASSPAARLTTRAGSRSGR